MMGMMTEYYHYIFTTLVMYRSTNGKLNAICSCAVPTLFFDEWLLIADELWIQSAISISLDKTALMEFPPPQCKH